jgi:uncharacterized repeat protein (TIGR01451 family)
LGDALPSDNYDTLEVVVVGSYDPNAKYSHPSGVVPSSYIDASGWIEYTVMFQNTGTDTAFTVAVRDTIDPYLDLSTFEFVGSSHPCTWRLAGPRLMEFFFPGILLPDSNVNEPASHGVFQYRIKALSGVPSGAAIANTAHIYFDYNPPVATNTAYIFVDTLLLGVQPSSGGSLIKVWPNPACTDLNIELQPGSSDVHEALLFNLQGKEVCKISIVEGINTFSIDHLPSGVYLLRTNVPECQTFRIVRINGD